jgi:hypothetical protein
VPAILLWYASHRPCLDLGFVGDDFQWWQHARMALERPGLLLAPHGGYRPLNTWTMAVDHLLYGTAPRGYHLTSLLWHLGCGAVFWALLGRLGVSAAARGAAVAIWLCSPYTLEPAQAVCERFEPALLAAWLGLAVLWPRQGERWRPARVAGAVGLVALTAMTKETWVALPAFVVLFELVLSRSGWRSALRRGGLAALGPLAYVAGYFALPPIAPGSFFGAGIAGALKVPHALAVFSGLTDLRPMEFAFGPAEAAAVALAGVFGWLAWRWRSGAMAVGFGFFLFPLLPVLPVGWMTSRYTFMPLAGFLTVAAAAADAAVRRAGPRSRIPLTAGLGLLACVVLAAGLAALRGDMADARSLSLVHGRLVAEAEAFAPGYPRQGAVVAVRLDRREPLRDLSQVLQGTAKTFFVRGDDPAGLADWAALLSYVLDPRGGPLLAAVRPAAAGVTYTVVGYSDGGFVELPRQAATVEAEVAAWRTSGRTPRVLLPWQPR